RFPEYHTSADNLNFVHPECLADSFLKCLAVLQLLEANKTYVNQNPKCEPQLGKRGIYRGIGSQRDAKSHESAMLWVLNYSDRNHTLLDITEKSGLAFEAVRNAAEVLLEHGLLKEKPEEGQ
ncbi:MAG: DUF4910 domain-containing protein, partial [Candidatus Methylomirabilis sp.]